MSQQIIEVVVATDGKVTVQTKGFSGSACKAASESLERALGLKQTEKLTAEFYAEQTASQRVQESQR